MLTSTNLSINQLLRENGKRPLMDNQDKYDTGLSECATAEEIRHEIQESAPEVPSFDDPYDE